MNDFDEVLTDKLKDAFSDAIVEQIDLSDEYETEMIQVSAIRAAISILVDNGYLFNID